MKNTIKVFGIIALALIIGFGMIACSDGGGGGKKEEPFTISGTFASQANDINAKFYASATDGRSARAARAAENETEMEGLLEDGDITFKLKGSYNSATKLYVLSAASSFLRYSISGDIDSSEPGKAIVQVKSGSDWTVIEIDVAVTTSGGTFSGKGEAQDALASGIPQEMWGVWWGSEPIEKGKGDIVLSGKYYYAIDAFTIVQYVDRLGTWNVEAYTCFFEGLTKAGGVSSGRVEFNYVDQVLIDTTHPDWWSECIIDYVNANGTAAEKTKIANVNWFDDDWKTLLNKYAALANADGTVGATWDELFGEAPYSYKAYRKDALRLPAANQLQIGKYFNSFNTYFSKNANDVNGYSDLRWESNIYNRAVKSTAPVPAPVESNVRNISQYAPNDFIDLSSSKDYSVVDLSGESRKGVIKVVKPNGGTEWSVVQYNLEQYRGREMTITFSADVKRVGGDGMLLWQINNKPTWDVVGSPIANAPANIWHSMNGSWTGTVNGDDGNYLYLTAANSNSPNTTYYVSNFSISIEIEGEYHFSTRYTWTNGGDSNRGWLLSPEIRAAIANGTIKYFVIGLDAEAVSERGGIAGIGMVLNREGTGNYTNHEQAFPWYYEDGKSGPHADWNGWISYDALTTEYGATVNDWGLWLQYDLTSHPGYTAFKTAMGAPDTYWAQFGINIWKGWEDGKEWVPIRSAFFKPGT